MSNFITISFILFLFLSAGGYGIFHDKVSSFNGNIIDQADIDSQQKIEVTEPTIVIVQLDSMEIEKIKNEQGEDIFYTAADDLMWYNSMLLEQMDSLNIPVIYIKEDTIDVKTPNSTYRIVKDSTFSLYTYFHFDGNEVLRKDLFELLEE